MCPASTEWVAWVSIDPRSARLMPYPAQVAQRLEIAWQAQETCVELGESFYDARVELHPRLVQRTAKGSRDVCRVQLADPLGPAVVSVVKGADWRAFKGTDDSSKVVEEQQVAIAPGAAVKL